jgi:AraC-like DNA-binding protein
MEKRTRKLIKSKIFIRLFFSYVLLILLFFSVYAGSIIAKSRSVYRESMELDFQQKTESLSNWMDVQLLSARNIIASINNSETIKTLYNRTCIENATVDSVLFYKVQTELTNFKVSSSNLAIYSVLLNFVGAQKAYSSSGVIDFQGETPTLSAEYFGVTSVANLWDVKNTANIQINKNYLIYASTYYVTLNSSVKGTVLVLFDSTIVLNEIRDILEGFSGVRILYNGSTVLEDGICEGREFAETSSLHKGLGIHVFADPDVFVQPFASAGNLPLILSLLVGLLFIVATYFISKHYYLPFGRIERIIETVPSEQKDEVESIISGIRSLIGERNGYREKMVIITPYAKQGMLHGILTGDVHKDRLQILIDEQYIDLKLPYFMLALVNIAYTGNINRTDAHYHDIVSIIGQVCREMSSEDTQIDCYTKDVQNVYIIVNSNIDQELEDIFFKLHKRIVKEIDDALYAVTIGVGKPESDLERLQEACKDAQLALERMLAGGRNAVYFFEEEQSMQAKTYHFPKDAVRRLTKDFKEGLLDDLQAFLNELYEKNIRDTECTPSGIHLMVDELHITTLNALKAASGLNTTRIQIERIKEAATIEEIFAYYVAIFQAVCEQLPDLIEPDQAAHKLKDEIIAYVDEHCQSPDLSLASLASRFGVSTKYICLVFKANLNTTYLQYVREKQIRRAAELLRNTGEPLETIATQCGFTNMLTFRRNFKSVMGINPSDYRS